MFSPFSLMPLLCLMLVLSAFFSGSETALFSLNKFRLLRMSSRLKGATAVRKILQEPARLLITILFGNMLVNVALSAICTYIAIRIFGEKGIGLAILAVSALLLIFGEMVPKNLAVYHAESFARRAAPILLRIEFVLNPILRVFYWIARWLQNAIITPRHITEPFVTKDELKTLVQEGLAEGAIRGDEEQMISRIFQFTDTRVQTVMIPRLDIVAVPDNLSQSELLRFLRRIKHSKIPVYHKRLDSIRGILYAKDVFLEPHRSYISLVKPAYYVPESKGIMDLFEELRSEKRRMAIVVDEYGGTCGLVTMEDILEEIFGEIYDEYEVMQFPIRRIGYSRYRVDARVPIKDVNRALNLALPQEDYDTIAGFMLELFEEIPKSNVTATYGAVRFTVERVVHNRILSVLMDIT